MIPDEPTTSTQEQRRSARHVFEAPVSMKFEIDSIEGISDNISQVGVMFFTEQPLRVTVEIEEEGGTRSYSGRLMRLQRLNETSTGLAIEFDDAG